MSRARKFMPGPVFENVHELINAVTAGSWVYWTAGTRPKHPSVILSMQLNTLIHTCRSGRLRLALPTESSQKEPAA